MSGEAKEKSTTGKLETAASSQNTGNQTEFGTPACARPQLNPNPTPLKRVAAGSKTHDSKSPFTEKTFKIPQDSILSKSESTDQVAKKMSVDMFYGNVTDPPVKLSAKPKGDTRLANRPKPDEGARSSTQIDTKVDELPDDYRERIMRVLGSEGDTLAGIIPWKPMKILKIYVDCKDEKQRQQDLKNALSTDWTIVINGASQCPKLEVAGGEFESSGDGKFTVYLMQGDGFGKFSPLSSARLTLFLRSTDAFKMKGCAETDWFYALTVFHLFAIPNFFNKDSELYYEHSDKLHSDGINSEDAQRQLHGKFCDHINNLINMRKLKIRLHKRVGDVDEYIIGVTKVYCGHYCRTSLIQTDAVLLELKKGDIIFDILGKGDVAILNSVRTSKPKQDPNDDQRLYLNEIKELNTPEQIHEFCSDDHRSIDFFMDNICMKKSVKKYEPWLKMLQELGPEDKPDRNLFPTSIWTVPEEIGGTVEGYSGSTLRMRSKGSSNTYGVGILHGQLEDKMNELPILYCEFYSLSYQIGLLESIQNEFERDSIDLLCHPPVKSEDPTLSQEDPMDIDTAPEPESVNK